MERPSMILDVDGKQQLYEWKLSEYSSHVEPAFEFTRRYINELEAENSKLRELALGLHKCWLNEGCEGCPMQDSDGWCIRDIRLHELEVEV